MILLAGRGDPIDVLLLWRGRVDNAAGLLSPGGASALWFAFGGRLARESAGANGAAQNQRPPGVAAVGLIVEAECCRQETMLRFCEAVQCSCDVIVVQMKPGQAGEGFFALGFAVLASAFGLFGSVAIEGCRNVLVA